MPTGGAKSGHACGRSSAFRVTPAVRPGSLLQSAAVCGRFTNTGKKSDDIQKKLAEKLRVPQPDHNRGYERFNVSPTQEVLAVVDDDAGRRLELVRWGLVPRWAKAIKVGYKMINARAETLAERPAYRGLVRRAKHRCLILADGYYEWQKPEDPRQPRRPFHLSLVDGEPFCFAGLWTGWSAPDGSVVPSCTIVTCEANELARPIHERMPVILAESESWEAWLDPAVDGDAAAELLVPLAADRMAVRAANAVVNSARHEGPDCLALAA
jgi:putative SOS response-associated peptidase YedK